MRRLGVLVLGVGLSFAPASSAGLALPAPTCSYPEPSFGVLMDEDAIAAGALDEIYVDGVVAVPIRLGLGLANIQSPAELLERGFVNLDIVAPDGSALPGELEMLPGAAGGPIAYGQAAWLIWTGAEPFAAQSEYAIEFSFVNENLIDCPEAVSSSGKRMFRTGVRSAAEDVVPPNILGAQLLPSYLTDPGCCSIPDTDACKLDGKCFACWQNLQQITSAQVIVESSLPLTYFSFELSLAEGELVTPLVAQSPLYATFSVTQAAPEYCFDAGVRPRAGGEALASVTRCVPGTEYIRMMLDPNLTELPAESCADGPLAERTGQGIVALAALAATEAQARAVVTPVAPVGSGGTPSVSPMPVQPTPTSPPSGLSDDGSSSDSCALSHRTGSPLGVGLALLGLVACRARVRRQRRANP